MSDIEATLSREADALLTGAERAAAEFVDYDRERVARIVRAVAEAALEHAESLAVRAVEETGFGVLADKVLKNETIAKTFLEEYAESNYCDQRIDSQKRMLLIPRPAGVVLGITPSTSPIAAVCYKVLCALLTRNAIVISPHPGAKRVCTDTAQILARAAEQAGAPRNVVQVLPEPSIPVVEAMMADDRVKLVIATGGGAVVRAAYRSGTPAIGVGPGNSPVVVDETADLKQVAEKLIRSKSYDNGVLCTTESVLIAVDSIAPRLVKLLTAKGAHLCSATETQRLREYMFPGGKFNTKVVGRDAAVIAAEAGFSVPKQTKVLIAPIESTHGNEVLTHEKLSPVLAYLAAPDFSRATAAARQILDVTGIGHSAAIHSENAQRVLDYSFALPVHRIAVNVPASLGNAGIGTYLPVSMSLGTGYIGGSSSSENLNPDHFVQWSSVAYSTNIFDKFPDFDELRRSSVGARPESGGTADVDAEAIAAALAPELRGALGRDDLRRIVREELRDLIGAR